MEIGIKKTRIYKLPILIALCFLNSADQKQFLNKKNSIYKVIENKNCTFSLAKQHYNTTNIHTIYDQNSSPTDFLFFLLLLFFILERIS